jgi:hypothetical protein
VIAHLCDQLNVVAMQKFHKSDNGASGYTLSETSVASLQLGDRDTLTNETETVLNTDKDKKEQK